MKTKVISQEIDAEALSLKQLAYIGEALKTVVKPVLQDAKANLSGYIRTGALRDSLKTKVAIGKKNTSVYGLVGIDSKFSTYDDYGNKIKPSKYAHLVEYGSRNTPPALFLTKAANNNRNKINNAVEQASRKAMTENI